MFFVIFSTYFLLMNIMEDACDVLLNSTQSLTLRCLSLAAMLTQTLLGLQFFQPSRTGGSTESNTESQFRGLSHLNFFFSKKHYVISNFLFLPSIRAADGG